MVGRHRSRRRAQYRHGAPGRKIRASAPRRARRARNLAYCPAEPPVRLCFAPGPPSLHDPFEERAVTPPDDRESKPESPAPPDSGKYLSPRLRAKLESGGGGRDEDFDFLNRKRSPVGLILTIVIVVAAIGGVVLLVNNSRQKAKAEAAEAAQVAAAGPAKAGAASPAGAAQPD